MNEYIKKHSRYAWLKLCMDISPRNITITTITTYYSLCKQYEKCLSNVLACICILSFQVLRFNIPLYKRYLNLGSMFLKIHWQLIYSNVIRCSTQRLWIGYFIFWICTCDLLMDVFSRCSLVQLNKWMYYEKK